MAATNQQVLEDALRLPAVERANVAAQLIESLDEDVDDDVEAAWEEEIARRIRDYEAGRSKPIPWTKAREIILGAKRESVNA